MIEDLYNASIDIQLAALEKSLSELRKIVNDLNQYGEAVWERFGTPPEEIAKQYSGIIDALFLYQNYEETREQYWELNALYKDAFVKCYMNEAQDTLYQVDIGGEIYAYDRYACEWVELDTMDGIPLIPITRQAMESIEDAWEEALE